MTYPATYDACAYKPCATTSCPQLAVYIYLIINSSLIYSHRNIIQVTMSSPQVVQSISSGPAGGYFRTQLATLRNRLLNTGKSSLSSNLSFNLTRFLRETTEESSPRFNLLRRPPSRLDHRRRRSLHISSCGLPNDEIHAANPYITGSSSSFLRS